jgi:cystathionine gamma-synthase
MAAEPREGPAFETLAIHGGQPPDPSTGAVITPIYQTSTYAQSSVGQHQGYDYSRSGNPTRTALESCLAALEGAAHGSAFSSGLAAEDAILRLLNPGDHVLIGNDFYGGTYRLLSQVHTRIGIGFTPVALTESDLLAAWQPGTRMVWVETPSNPLLRVAGRDRPRARCLVGRRQHVRHAVSATTSRAGGRRGGPLDDEIPGRTQRRDRRFRRHLG